MADEVVYLTIKETAKYIGVTEARLQYWRKSRRLGPPFYKPAARTVLYKKSDLDAFMASKKVAA